MSGDAAGKQFKILSNVTLRIKGGELDGWSRGLPRGTVLICIEGQLGGSLSRSLTVMTPSGEVGEVGAIDLFAATQ